MCSWRPRFVTTMGCPNHGEGILEAKGGPLPGRTNIVLTTNRDYSADGAHVVHSLEEAFPGGRSRTGTDTKTIWSSAAQVFASTMDMVDELYVTDLDLKVTPEADAHPFTPPPSTRDREVVSTDKDGGSALGTHLAGHRYTGDAKRNHYFDLYLDLFSG